MKKLLVVMVITLMMTSGAYALQADWQVDLDVVAVNGTVQSMGTASVGAITGDWATGPGADLLDSEYVPALAGTYELDIVNGAMGARSQCDYVAAPTATSLDLWTLKLSLNGGAAGVPVKVVAKFNDFGGAFPITDSAFQVMMFAGQLTLEQAKAATPIWQGNLANYAAFTAGFEAAPATLAAGGSQYYTLLAGTVPEPGSMLALFSGLVGLVGFGIRRRR